MVSRDVGQLIGSFAGRNQGEYVLLNKIGKAFHHHSSCSERVIMDIWCIWYPSDREWSRIRIINGLLVRHGGARPRFDVLGKKCDAQKTRIWTPFWSPSVLVGVSLIWLI